MQNHVLRRCAGALLLVAIFMVGVAGSTPPKIALRVHVQTTMYGAPGTQNLPVNLMNPSKQIMVKAQPELSERDIAKVESAPADNGMALRLTLTEHGKIVLNTVTTQSQGSIMVIFLNGRVVYAPIIDRIIYDGVLIIPGAVAPDEVPLLENAVKEARK